MAVGWNEAELKKVLGNRYPSTTCEGFLPSGSVTPVQHRGRAHGKSVPGEMNKLEEAYAANLEQQRMLGQILSWRWSPMKLRLAKGTFYDIDFWVIQNDGLIEIHETKGHWEDDARVKIKVAAAMFHEFRFIAVQRIKGIWKHEAF